MVMTDIIKQINSASKVEFLRRFGGSGDGTLRRFEYSIDQRYAKLWFHLADATEDFSWHEVYVMCNRVELFRFNQRMIHCDYLVNEIVVVNFNNGLVFDFWPSRSSELDEEYSLE